jgi:cerevisin
MCVNRFKMDVSFAILGVFFLIIAHPYGATPVKSIVESSEGGIAGEYLVMLTKDYNMQDKMGKVIEEVKGIDGVEVREQFTYNHFGALLVRSTDPAQLQQILGLPEVELIEQNSRKKKVAADDGECISQDTMGDLWGLSRISSVDRPNYPYAKYFYNKGDGEGVDVYVVDTGVYLEHSEFEGRAYHGFTANGVRSEGDVDKNGHGTHVAGTIAGKSYGVAKKANIISVKVVNQGGAGTDDDTLKGLIWAADDHKGKSQQSGKNKRSVINMSLEGFTNTQGYVYTQEALIQEIVNDGIPIVVAAGRLALDSCAFTPSRVSSLITVGATNYTDTLASFSAFGPCVDILAPGVDIKSASISSPTASVVRSGTSMAAPHVTGAVARFMSREENMPTVASVEAWLKNSASNGKIYLGHLPTIGQGKMSTPNKLLYIGCLDSKLICIYIFK